MSFSGTTIQRIFLDSVFNALCSLSDFLSHQYPEIEEARRPCEALALQHARHIQAHIDSLMHSLCDMRQLTFADQDGERLVDLLSKPVTPFYFE